MASAPERPTTFGEAIRREREARGWTQVTMGAYLSEALNRPLSKLITGNEVGRWESGRHEPSLSIFEGYARVFGWPLPWEAPDPGEELSTTRVWLNLGCAEPLGLGHVA